MGADRLIASLLRVADEDLRGARLLADDGNRNAIYLLSQAAEKVIRAVLTSEGIHAGIRHLLDEMVDQVPDANPLKPQLRAVQHLGAYATSFRYPTAAGRIQAAPLAGVFELEADKVASALRAATQALGVDPSGTGPAANPVPTRRAPP